MRSRVRRAVATALDRSLLALLLALATLMLAMNLVGPRAAHSTEIVPQVIVGGPTGSGQNQTSFGIALRQDMGPALQSEIATGVHFDDVSHASFRSLRSPLTASLWVSPGHVLYAGGGVGWYPRDLWRATTAELSDAATFGYHAGGGVRLPVIPPTVGIDLGARWMYRGDGAASRLFGLSKADAFATTAGLVFRF